MLQLQWNWQTARLGAPHRAGMRGQNLRQRAGPCCISSGIHLRLVQQLRRIHRSSLLEHQHHGGSIQAMAST